MRILVVSPFLPGPDVGHGAGVYVGALLHELAQHVERLELASVVALRDLPLREPAAYRRDAVVRAQLPELDGLPRLGHRAAAMLRWAAGQPLAAAKIWSRTLASRIAATARALAPDVCLIEHTLAAPAATLLSGVCPTILTDHEAGAAIPTDLGGWMGDRDRQLWDRYVRRHYAAATALQAVTAEDAAALATRLERHVGVRPVTVPVPPTPIAAPADAPPRALFFGDFRHHPNAEAFALLRDAIWPRVRAAVPEAILTVCGRGSEHCAHVGRGIEGRGYVADLDRVLHSARVLLAPLLSGGGARVKVLTALAAGLGVVTNELGARGAAAGDPAIVRAQTPEDLAAATVTALREPHTAGRAGAAAHTWAKEHVAPERVVARQLETARALVAQADPLVARADH